MFRTKIAVRPFCLSTVIMAIMLVTVGCHEDMSTPVSSTPATAGSIDAEYHKYYDNLTGLCADADLIASGTITKTIEVLPDEATHGGLLNTKSAFKIDKVLKGNATGEIVLSQTGAIGWAEETGNPVFQVDEQWVLFLKERTGEFHLLTGSQGRYKLEDGKVSSMNYVLRNTPGLIVPLGLRFRNVPFEEFINRIEKTLGT